MSAGPQRNTDLVPLDERLLYLRVLRAVIAAATVLDATLLPHLLRKPFITVAASALAYLVVCVLAELFWRLMHRRGLWLFGSLLMLDGLYLAWASYMTGGFHGPPRHLLLVPLRAVPPLASYPARGEVAPWRPPLPPGGLFPRRGG